MQTKRYNEHALWPTTYAESPPLEEFYFSLFLPEHVEDPAGLGDKLWEKKKKIVKLKKEKTVQRKSLSMLKGYLWSFRPKFLKKNFEVIIFTVNLIKV